MRFRLCIDRDQPEEVTAVVHERSALTDEIERLVLQHNLPDQIPGYIEDEIRMLDLAGVECFVVENEKTFAVYEDRKRYCGHSTVIIWSNPVVSKISLTGSEALVTVTSPI